MLNRKPIETDENELPPKPIDFQLFQPVSVENFIKQKFRFQLAKTKTNRTEQITPLLSYNSNLG